MPWEDALLGPFVESEPMERRRAEEAVVLELEIVDLRDERGPHPDLHGLRHVRFLGERALVLQGHGHPEDLLSNRIAESGPRTPDVSDWRAAVHAEDQGSKRVLPHAFPLREATDDRVDRLPLLDLLAF